jgi:hypothetical protein
MNPILTLLASVGGTLIDRLFPDPDKRAQAQIELLKLTHDQENRAAADQLARDLAQAKVNEVEAASSDTFRGGWRPFVGWVCGAGFAVNYVVGPLLPWLAALAGHQAPPLPQLDTDTLMGLLAGMLGLGTLRTVERVKGKV